MTIDFKKMDGLVPAIIQDARTQKVLMLGFMNEEAYNKTVETGKVTFWSRSRNCLWTKGETSGNFLNVVEILNDATRTLCSSRFIPTVLHATRVLTPAGTRRMSQIHCSSCRS